MNTDSIDKLRTHLIVPLAVSDILTHDLAIEPEMQYGLHMALSEIDPDSALLAIALCAQDLARKNIKKSHIAAALEIEADNIIADYGPEWLRHFQNKTLSPETFESVLETVPEDLEAMADLIDALCADLIVDEVTAQSGSALLGELLTIQARAHMEIADYILSEMEYEREIKQSEATGTPPPEADLIDVDAYKGSNIVLFPGTTRH